jgi:hypothetical protein
MKIQMANKEEECEKLEEEVISLRVKVDNLNKNLNNSPVLDRVGFGYIDETSCNAHVDPNKRLEEKSSKLPERKNEEKDKNYAEVLKGWDYGQQYSKMNEYKRDKFLEINF